MTTDIIAYTWHLWIDLFGGLGLPWSKQLSGSIALVVAFYLVGLCFKFLTARET